MEDKGKVVDTNYDTESVVNGIKTCVPKVHKVVAPAEPVGTDLKSYEENSRESGTVEKAEPISSPAVKEGY